MENKKDLFFITDLCQITKITNLSSTNGKTKYSYKPIKKVITYYKNKKYFDIETNQNYKITYQKIGDIFIKEPITPFSVYLKTNRIKYNNNEIRSKKKVKELYNENKK